MKMTKLRQSQTGFTIIELMISSLVFSVILLGATSALIQIGRMYYKGMISSRTQGTVRAIIDDISRSIQFSGDTPNVAGTDRVSINGTEYDRGLFCIGDTRYTYIQNLQINNQQPHALWRDSVTGPGQCNFETGTLPDLSAVNPGGSNGQELLEQHMRLGGISVGCNSDGRLCTVSVRVAYGDDDVLNFDESGTPVSCKGLTTGAQWCAVSELTATVFKRI